MTTSIEEQMTLLYKHVYIMYQFFKYDAIEQFIKLIFIIKNNHVKN